uniref:Putative terminase n=1 Tax=viral metagenome TaxID=1070528 RepID=A0A6M3J3C9_9ZZZZ
MIPTSPFRYHDPVWCQRNLQIVDKGGRRIPLRYNGPQRRLCRILQEEVAKGKPVRLICLKARQEGVSTFWESVGYCRTVREPGLRGLVLSHDPEGTANLYMMYRTYYEYDPGKLDTAALNMKGLRFAHGGQVLVQTAAKRFAGSGQTYQFVHFSEQAKWPFPSETSLSVLQSVGNLPNTMVLNESTAYGAGNYFHEQWKAASRGESEWRAVFLPWWEHDEYCLPAEEELEDLGKDPTYNVYEGQEGDLASRFGLLPGQLAWRRWCIRANCGGSAYLFDQEYPAAPEDAFLAGGTPRFDVRVLQKWYQACAETPPLFIGRTELRLEERSPTTETIGDEGGWLRVWDWPRPGEKFVLFGDCAGENPEGDHNAAAVLRTSSLPWKQVATLHGLRGADLYGRALANVGYLYGKGAGYLPVLGWEVNGVGEAMQSHLRHWYPEEFCYHRLPIDRMVKRPGERIGWYTGRITRHNMIEDLDAAIRDETLEVPDEDTLLELLSFQRVPGPRNGEHKPGAKDDRVFALGGCLQIAGYSQAQEYEHYDPSRHKRASGPAVVEA